MSFEIFFQPCRFGTETVEKKNPFTREAQKVRRVLPLNSHDLKAVGRVLDRARAVGPDEHGGYLVRFGDGGEAEVDVGDGHGAQGLTVSCRGLTPGLSGFLFEMLSAADWIMLPAMEGDPAITALPGRAEGVADRFPEVVCNSAEELGAVLAKGVNRWTRYRDQVVEGSG